MGKNITNTVSVPLHLILLRIKCWLIYPEFLLPLIYYCSVAWVLSNSLRSHELQHARCPSPTPEVCPSSCPLHQWCHPGILSSDALFSFCPQSFPASGTFPMSRLFTSNDQNTGASASASVLPTVFRVDFPYDWLAWFPIVRFPSHSYGLQLILLTLRNFGPNEHWFFRGR